MTPPATPMRLGFPVKVMGAPGLKSNDTRRWRQGPHLKTSLEWPCCTDQGYGRSYPSPGWFQAMRTEIGRPSSSMRFRAWTATSTSVARRWSVRERSPSPITCLNLPMAASARARFV